MAEIQNERDRYMRLSTARSVNVDPPGAIVVPGYTGLVLAADQTFFGGQYDRDTTTGAYEGYARGRAIVTASMRGMPANMANQIQWFSTVPLTETGDPLVKIMDGINWKHWMPSSFEMWATIQYGGLIHTSNSLRFIVMYG